MSLSVEQISQEIAKLNGKAQRELLEHLPRVLKFPSVDKAWLKLAEEGYIARRRIIQDIPLKRMERSKARRMHRLAEKYSSGMLTKAEEREYRFLVATVQQIMVENAKRLARHLRPDLLDTHGEIKKPVRRRSFSTKRAHDPHTA